MIPGVDIDPQQLAGAVIVLLLWRVTVLERRVSSLTREVRALTLALVKAHTIDISDVQISDTAGV